jgi:hypothetical protein
MSADDAEMRDLSEEARRWLGFFHLRSRDAARSAIDAGFIAPRKRPGFTPTVFDEIQAWAAGAGCESSSARSGQC